MKHLLPNDRFEVRTVMLDFQRRFVCIAVSVFM